MIEKLRSGRFRANVYDPEVGDTVNVKDVLTPGEMEKLGARRNTFATRSDARKAVREAGQRVGTPRTLKTFNQLREMCRHDHRLTRGLKESTLITNYDTTKKFADRYGERTLWEIEHDLDLIVDYLEDPDNHYTVPTLRATFNRARKPVVGRLMHSNPMERLGLGKSKGRRDENPPTEKQRDQLIGGARRLTLPSFADYFEFACTTGLRGGEIDALIWDRIDWDEDEIHVDVAWNQTSKKFDTPKYGRFVIALVGAAREILLRRWEQRDSDSPYVFTNSRGGHWTINSRLYYWNRVRYAAGLEEMDFYLCTRHYFGWYATNILGLDSQVVAEALGHRDGGELVRKLYGHRDKRRMREEIRKAHDAANGIAAGDHTPDPSTPDAAPVVVLRPYFRRVDEPAESEPMEVAA